MIKLSDLQKIEKASATRKTVKRSYTSKKTGKQTTKEYVYSKSPLLFRKTKTGYKLIDKAWDEFEANIQKTQPEKAVSLINEARRIKNDILHGNEIAKYGGAKQYSSSGQKGWNRIDVHSLISRLAANSVDKYLNNMGLSLEEVTNYVNSELDDKSAADNTDYGNVNSTDIANPGNWHSDTCTVRTTAGITINIIIKFNYDGVDAIKIQF